MGETGMNNNKIYYTIPYKESGDFDVTIWYGNGNILSNKTHVPVTGGYMTSGTPSAPGEILDQPNIPTDNSITFRFRGSTQIDVNDSASSANLQFKVSHVHTHGSEAVSVSRVLQRLLSQFRSQKAHTQCSLC